ncbi:hypothetical protein [Microbulbifer sp. DLAB2-AA]|uniref:hypothetical protein n=1 Tax=Microbulbifer sp. DLAB2-AA TaxID=3243394 RepID=UPI004039B75A
MRKYSQNIAKRVLLGLMLLGVQGGAYASTISPWSGHSDEISLIDNESVDTLRIRSANSSGISYNQFNTFSVSGQPLQLLNIPGQLEDSSSVEPASLIVIAANHIDINGSVEILGAPADVLFISKDNYGTIKCSNCSFDNIARLTFAVGSPASSITDTSSNIGALTVKQGAVTIKNMEAPGALLFEVLANELNLDGSINLQQPVNKEGYGYVPSEDGKYKLGTGLVNALIGNVNWNYDSQQIENITTIASSSADLLKGQIQAASVKLTSSRCLLLETDIDTTSDFLSSVRYKDQVLSSGESITVQSFGNCTSKIEGNIKSDGDITLKSNSDLLFPISASDIQGYNLVAIAKGRIENKADLFAHKLELAADEFVNFGQLEGGSTLAVWADKNVYNQFGGRITGGTVDVQSQNGFVRNGSRTPYLAPESSVNKLLTFVSDDLILTTSETSELGTFYRSEINVSTTNSHHQPADTSAQIHGQKVRIKAKGFENINPYWEQVPESQYTLLSRNRVNQTAVAGENGLEIEARNYILNSSAVLRVNNKSGGFKIDAPYIINERYRNLTLLDRNYYTGIDSSNWDRETEETIDSRAYTYSPPGIIVSLGDLEAYASKGIINSTGYLEIFGNAVLTTGVLNEKGETVTVGRLHDYGIGYKGVSKTTVDKFSVCIGSSNLPVGFDVECQGGGSGPDTQIVVNDARYADSLFYIHGNVKSNSQFVSRTLNTFDGFQEVAIGNLITAHAPEWWEDEYYYMHPLAWATDGRVPVWGGWMTNQTWTPSTQISNDTLKLFWTHDWYFEVSDATGCSSSSCIPLNLTSGERSKAESKEFSLFEVMKDMYESLKSTISKFFAEFDWWT